VNARVIREKYFGRRIVQTRCVAQLNRLVLRVVSTDLPQMPTSLQPDSLQPAYLSSYEIEARLVKLHAYRGEVTDHDARFKILSADDMGHGSK
jgi:hypothetical protein